MPENVYFITDAHLGSWALDNNREREKLLIDFLDSVRDKAKAIYMLGDMFDFWYEFKYVVPKGYTRFLGKLSELTDSGIEIHYFTGNHDIWSFSYLQEECGVILHKEPAIIDINGKKFYLAHGDGMGDPSRSFRILRSIFKNRFCQFCFSLLPTRWSIYLGMRWAKHSTKGHLDSGIVPYQGESNEHLVQYAKQYLKNDDSINYFIFGHRHIELDLMLSRESRVLILGDWISQKTFAEFNGDRLVVDNF